MAYNPALPVGPFKTRTRLSNKGRIAAGRGVVVTNPKATEQKTRRRNATLGMGQAPAQERRY